MNVSQLISALKDMPADVEVYHLWDGAPRTAINVVYLSKEGTCITSDYEEVCYGTMQRPLDAPTSAEDPYWTTEKSHEVD